jgi:hypothetical protein
MKAQKEMETAIKEYGALLNSEEMKEREENSYNEMKKTLETSTDPNEIRRIKKTIMDALKDDYKFNPLNDIEGDCATTLTFLFDTVEEAKAFERAEGVYGIGGRPIDAAKHVYNNWMPVMEKRGALNPKMDPFKMEANKDIIPNYTHDMCKKSLDILSRTVLFGLNPDLTEGEVAKIIDNFKKVKA